MVWLRVKLRKPAEGKAERSLGEPNEYEGVWGGLPGGYFIIGEAKFFVLG